LRGAGVSDICTGVGGNGQGFAEAKGAPASRKFGHATMNEQEIPDDVAEAMKRRLLELRSEHRDLDAAIAALEAAGPLNGLQVQRLKKRKLSLRDQIMRLENLLLPDIIA
jgi:hypothetical protein